MSRDMTDKAMTAELDASKRRVAAARVLGFDPVWLDAALFAQAQADRMKRERIKNEKKAAR